MHALINLGAILGIAKAVQVLKANSSRWMNERPRTQFEWQEGYFACTFPTITWRSRPRGHVPQISADC